MGAKEIYEQTKAQEKNGGRQLDVHLARDEGRKRKGQKTKPRPKTHEKLTPIRIGTRIGHSQDSSTREPQMRVNLICELVSIDGGSASTSSGGISSLDHEVLGRGRGEGSEVSLEDGAEVKGGLSWWLVWSRAG